METVNDNFLPDSSEKMLEKSIDKILEIIFKPLVKNNSFCDEYVEQEKENLKQIINGKIDNKVSTHCGLTKEEKLIIKQVMQWKDVLKKCIKINLLLCINLDI